MAACEASVEADEGASSVAQRAEELFDKLAKEEAVSSESAGLVVALVYLDLQVTEEQVVEATREILQPTEKTVFEGCVFAFRGTVAAAAFCDRRQHGCRGGRRRSARYQRHRGV